MKIGVPKNKIHEYGGSGTRGRSRTRRFGTSIVVQSGAGAGIGFDDSKYQLAELHLQEGRDISRPPTSS